MENQFTPLREWLWPIRREETGKVLLMGGMLFFFLFNYNIMRNTIEAVLIHSIGAETLPVLKFWGTMPLVVLFALLYAQLANHFSPKVIFNLIIFPFLLFFLTFGFYFYPHREELQANFLAERIQLWMHTSLPGSFETLIVIIEKLIRDWIYALFYILTELWGSAGITLLFWQFANRIIATEEAKRFYPRFMQMGNFSLIFSGISIVYLTVKIPADLGDTSWETTVKWLMLLIAGGTAAILIAHAQLHRLLAGSKTEELKKKAEQTLSLGMMASVRYILASPYLLALALIVLGYGTAFHILEVVYKSYLKEFFPTKSDLSIFQGYISIAIGLCTFTFVNISGFVLRKFSWFSCALITPLFLLLTAIPFFLMVKFQEGIAHYAFVTPLTLAVGVGAMQHVFVRATKYSVYDPTKEMAYIPLELEAKVKGKAAIDVVGSRLGKSGMGFILQAVLLIGPFVEVLGILFGMVALIVSLWIAGAQYIRERMSTEGAALAKTQNEQGQAAALAR